MDSGPLARPPKPPFDRERFVFKTLAVVIGTQLLIYSLAAGVCSQRALQGRPVGQICPGTLEQLQSGFDSTLKLLGVAGRSSADAAGSLTPMRCRLPGPGHAASELKVADTVQNGSVV